MNIYRRESLGEFHWMHKQTIILLDNFLSLFVADELDEREQIISVKVCN